MNITFNIKFEKAKVGEIQIYKHQKYCRSKVCMVSQMNTGTVSKTTLAKLPREKNIDRVYMGFSERIDTILN